MTNRDYTKEETLILDKNMRGKTYINNRSKNIFFLHCAVLDIDTKRINLILSNVYLGEMISVQYHRFVELIYEDKKHQPRFELVVKPIDKPKNLEMKFVDKVSTPNKLIQEYEDRDNKQEGFKPKS